MSATRIGTGCEILSLAVDPYSNQPYRIACGTRNQYVQVFAVDDQWSLESVFSVQLPSTVAKSIAFSGNSRNDVLAFGLFDGLMQVHGFFACLRLITSLVSVTLNGRDGTIMAQKNMGLSFWCVSLFAEHAEVLLKQTLAVMVLCFLDVEGL